MKSKASPQILDLGCGPNKVEGAYGVDGHPYEGVDKVFDLDSAHWPLPKNTFDHIYARHIIEHVKDIKAFMNEIHNIAAPNAIVEITTPHFSSIHSWQDPTHRWHLSCKWYKPFTEQYLAEQVLPFEHISTDLSFSSGSFHSLKPRFLIWLKGLNWWEKHYGFTHGARNITTKLRVLKEQDQTRDIRLAS